MAKEIYCSEYVFPAKAIKELIENIKDDAVLDKTSLSVRVLIHDHHDKKIFKFEVEAILVDESGNKNSFSADSVSGCPRPPSC